MAAATSHPGTATQVQAYILVDACSKQLVDKLQRGLRCMANVLSVSDDATIEPALGVCMIKRSLDTKEVQLQVLLQPQSYSLRDWHLAVGKMQASEAHQQPDDKKLAMAMKTLLDHLKAQKKKETHKTLVQHLHVIAHSFTFLPTYGKLLQEAASSGIQVHFCCGSTSEPAESAASAAAAAGAMPPGTAQFFATLAAHDNATTCSFNQMLLEWITEQFGAPQQLLQVQMPKPVAGKNAFLVSSSQLVARVKTTTQAGRLCPCHMAPVVPASTAAEVMCSVSRQALLTSACKPENSVVQLGHRTHLRLSAFSSALPKLQQQMLEPGLRAPGALPGLQVLEVQSTIRLQDVNQAAVYGRAQLLCGISRDLVGDAAMPDSASQDSDVAVFAALTESLLQEGKALLATSLFDADAEAAGFLKTHYVLRPTGVPGNLLCCKLASAEQLLAIQETSAAAPAAELVAAVTQEIAAWHPAGLTPVGFVPTSLAAGYHDLINQLVRDSQKPPPMAAAAPSAAAAAPAPAPAAAAPSRAAAPAAAPATASIAAVQHDTKRLSLSRAAPAGQPGMDQNQQPQGGAGRGAAVGAAGGRPPQVATTAADGRGAAANAATKGKTAAGRQRVSSSSGAAGPSRGGRAPLQPLQLTRK